MLLVERHIQSRDVIGVQRHSSSVNMGDGISEVMIFLPPHCSLLIKLAKYQLAMECQNFIYISQFLDVRDLRSSPLHHQHPDEHFY